MRENVSNAAILEWQLATDEALAGLEAWRDTLTAWGDGGPATTADLDLALGLLDVAGLGEWWQCCPAAGGVDGLTEALEEGSWTN